MAGRLLIPLLAGLLVVSLRPAMSDEPVLTAAQTQGAVRLDSLTIPTPGEFFAAIDKVERPNWSQLIRPTVLPNTTNRVQIALTLGTRVADGFIAVEAQDGQQVKNIGKDIIQLSKQLGVSQSILARGNSITDFADNNEWSALKEEIEATQNEVKLKMAEQKDEDLVALVSIGAWIRGTQAASDVAARKYNVDAAKLLRQPAVIEYLQSEVARLPERLQADEFVVNVRDGLSRAATLVALPSDVAPGEQAVVGINEAMAQMVDTICGPVPAPATTP
jgi:hypothetical protein